MKTFKEFLAEDTINEQSVIDRLEKFAGSKIKPGRNVIKDYPVYIHDNPDGTYIEMDAMDKDAAKGLSRALRSAKFRVTRDGDTGITIK